MRFKTKRISRDFWDHTDYFLRVVLEKLDEYCSTRWHKHIMLTCLVRSPEENKRADGVPNSKHMPNRFGKCCAADIRIVNEGHPNEMEWLTGEEAQDVVKYFRNELAEKRGDAILLKVNHIHVQVAIRDMERNNKPIYFIGQVE